MKNLLKNKSRINYLENSFAAYMKKDSILYILFKNHLVLNHKSALQIVSDRLRFQSYTSYHVICDVSGIKCISEAARDYLATKGSYQIKAVALISNTSTLYEMGNIYRVFNKPKVSTELFDNLQAAEEYIKNLIEKP